MEQRSRHVEVTNTWRGTRTAGATSGFETPPPLRDAAPTGELTRVGQHWPTPSWQYDRNQPFDFSIQVFQVLRQIDACSILRTLVTDAVPVGSGKTAGSTSLQHCLLNFAHASLCSLLVRFVSALLSDHCKTSFHRLCSKTIRPACKLSSARDRSLRCRTPKALARCKSSQTPFSDNARNSSELLCSIIVSRLMELAESFLLSTSTCSFPVLLSERNQSRAPESSSSSFGSERPG